MILHIPNVLNQNQVKECRELLNKADWIDGKLTAGSQAVNVKSNLQLAENNPLLQYLRDLITQALKTNPLFVSAALPNHIISPCVNRYENSGAYGNHVDNSILYDTTVAKNFRTDVSSSLFFTNPAPLKSSYKCLGTIISVPSIIYCRVLPGAFNFIN